MATLVNEGWFPNNGGGEDPLIGSFDATGCNYLRFWVFTGGTEIDSIVYGAQTPTLIPGAISTFPFDPFPALSVYELLAPTTGSHAFTVELDSAPGRHFVYITGWSGVHSSTPSGTPSSDMQEGANPVTFPTTSTSGQLVEAVAVVGGDTLVFTTTGGGVENELHLDWDSVGMSMSAAVRSTTNPTFTWTPGAPQDAFLVAVPINDAPAGGSVVTRSADDTILMTDQNVYGVRRYRLSADSILLTEGPTELSTIWMGELTEEGLTIEDSLLAFLRRTREGTDTIIVIDAVIKVLQFITIATDVLIATEGAVSSTLHQALVTDSLIMVDEYIRRMLITKLSEESLIVIDSVLSSANGQQIITAIAEDVIIVASQAFAELYRNRGLDDIVTMIDSRDQMTLRMAIASSVVELLDQVIMQFIRVVQLTDALELIDNVSALLTGVIVVNPSLIVIGADQPKIILGGYVV